MEKVTKSVLKEIVKECLVEILSEGMFPNSREPKSRLEESFVRPKKGKLPRPKQTKSRRRKSSNPMLEVASNLTDDPILSEMLSDTAQTTLPQQISADKQKNSVLSSISGLPGADKAAVIAESANPEELFGEEASSKWAKLAFNG